MRIVSMPRMRQVVWRQARFEEQPLEGVFVAASGLLAVLIFFSSKSDQKYQPSQMINL